MDRADDLLPTLVDICLAYRRRAGNRKLRGHVAGDRRRELCPLRGYWPGSWPSSLEIRQPEQQLACPLRTDDTHDANGNTLSDPSGKQYTWDFENRLVQAVSPGVGTTNFRYDPFGRRIQKAGPLGTTNLCSARTSYGSKMHWLWCAMGSIFCSIGSRRLTFV
jgi:YD repeat-containing protein